MEVSIINKSMDLADCRDDWFFDENHNCWCLEDVIYTPVPKVPLFQRLSIYAPKAMMFAPGCLTDQARTAPVVFHNSAAAYVQMPNLWLDSPRCKGQQYLDRGFVYITCGCSGRDSRNEAGVPVGKAPSTLVDLKTAIRFLRHNRSVLPGDLEKIISVGVSAGGAMSCLLGVTGDNEKYIPYLRENGAFMEESDSVFAAQIYCPIVDLEHADLAYEWMFHADKVSEDSRTAPAETMSPFKDALSALLLKQYIGYFNSLQLRNPQTGEILRLEGDGRNGSGYQYLMHCFEKSAAKHLTMMQEGKLPDACTVSQYLSGDYTYTASLRRPLRNPDAHHIGPGMDAAAADKPKTMGEMSLRPPKDAPAYVEVLPMAECQGTDKRHWLTWDGSKASIRDLDTYVLNHRRRMKPCTSFDKLTNDSGENQAFGTPTEEYVLFNAAIAQAIASLKERFPEEYALYYEGYRKVAENQKLAAQVHLYNPMDFIGTDEKSIQAMHYRIRVGGRDADTATTISMSLALKLANYGCGTVDYAIVWDQPHCDADYPGEVCDWIESICK